MDELAQQDIAAAAAVHTELGRAYDGAVAEGLVERISLEIDRQVDARLAQRGMRPSWVAWTNVAMGLGSVGLGIGATAVVLQSWPPTGVAPKAVLDLGSFRASLMTTTHSVSTAQLVLIAAICAGIAVINIVCA